MEKGLSQQKEQIVRRVKAINGKIGGENSFYCSDECKDLCPLYGFRSDHVDQRSKLAIEKSEKQKARACQTKSLKQLQCDSKGYNHCEKCGDIIDVELHHTLMISKHGKDAINSAGHILLCVGCHTELHNKC